VGEGGGMTNWSKAKERAERQIERHRASVRTRPCRDGHPCSLCAANSDFLAVLEENERLKTDVAAETQARLGLTEERDRLKEENERLKVRIKALEGV